jgi:hypothetical protein
VWFALIVTRGTAREAAHRREGTTDFAAPGEVGGAGAAFGTAFFGVVAVDAVGAGVGELVLYASGSSARATRATDGRPIDATIMAIVDTVDLGGKVVYQRG